MKLDNETNPYGNGKYVLINLRKIDSNPKTPEELAEAILKYPKSIEWGYAGSEDEFFLIKLKDKYAPKALHAYAQEAFTDDQEYATSVEIMAGRSGEKNKFCKKPD